MNRLLAGLLVSMIMLLLVTTGVRAEGARKVIRVGFFAFDGYHMMDADGTRSGYGYDFLRLISRYLNVDFEYVGYEKSWDDMQEMLANGEIDLVTSAQKTPEREARFDFSKAIGTSSGVLVVKADNASVNARNYNDFNGLRIGMLYGNSRNEDFAELAESRGLTYEPVYFSSAEDMTKALQFEEIDAIVSSSLRRAANERVVETFAGRDFYAMVRKGDTDLLNDINYAITQLNAAEGDWQNTLETRYYSQNHIRDLHFSEREHELIRQYIDGELTLTVTCSTDREPYSYVEDGELKGILPEIFALVMEQSGIPYTVVIPESREEYNRWQQEESVDLFMDCRAYSETSAEELGYELTAPYMDMRLAMVTRRDFDGTAKRIGVAKYQGTSGIESGLLQSAEQVMYDTREEAMQAVLDGKVDATYVYLYTAQRFVNQDQMGLLTYTALEEPVYQYSMCLNRQTPHELSGILTKCIYGLPVGEVERIISEYTSYKAGEMDLFTLMRLNKVASIIVIALLVLTLIVIAVLVTRLRARQQMLKLEQQRSEEMDRLVQKAEAANSSKSRFLFNMSHDIRTPLNAVMGYTDLAIEAGNDAARVQRYLPKIKLAGAHLLDIVNDVLEMSRIENGKVQLHETPCCIPDIGAAVLTMVEEQAQAKHQHIQSDFSGIRDRYVYCDALHVREVFVNLLSNAVKFTQPGGMIQHWVVQVPCETEGFAAYEIHIKDNGPGMSQKFLQTAGVAFEREQTATVSGVQGTGLGLAITRNLVELMGGKLELLSEEGKGTEAIVHIRHRLAVQQNGEADRDAQLYSGPKLDMTGYRILLVEDNELNREIVATILEQRGFVVEVAENGAVAVKMVQESSPGYYDAVLMDIQMPEMDGYEATRRIRALPDNALARIPVIALSANAFEEDRQKSLAVGMNAHLSKPIQPEEMCAAIQAFVAKRAGNT